MSQYEQLVKALRVCASAGECKICERDLYCEPTKMLSDAAAAIEALQAEVNALKETLKAVQKNSEINFKMWEEVQTEVERLKAEIIDCVCNGDLD